MSATRRTPALLCLAAALLLGAAARALDPSPPAGVASPSATVVAALPLPQVAERSEELATYLNDVRRRIEPAPVMEPVETGLPPIADRARFLQDETERLLENGPPLQQLDGLSQQWDALLTTLTGWSTAITDRATQLDQEQGGLLELRAIWRATRDAAQEARAPTATQDRVRSALGQIQDTSKQLDAYRQTLLALQDQLVQESSVCRAALARIAEVRSKAVGNLLVRDALPVWSAERWSGGWADSSAVAVQMSASAALVLDYLPSQAARVPFQVLLFAAVLFLWQQARRRTAGWAAEDASLAHIAAVFSRPISVAVLIALLAAPWIYPQQPTPLVLVLRVIAVVPLLRVLDCLVDRPLLPGLYVLGVLFICDQLRAAMLWLPTAEQILFLVEIAVGAVAPLWLLHSGRIARLEALHSTRVVGAVAAGARLVAACFAFALLAGLLGFMQLARVVAGAVLGSGYAAMLLFAVQHLADGAWAYALRMPLLRHLRLVREHRDMLQDRGSLAFVWVAYLLWAIAVLRAAELLSPMLRGLRVAFDAELQLGSVAVSAGSLFIFAATLVLAVVVSRITRFVLAEDVYPRMQLGAGLPYTLSRLVHYVIVLTGFVIALAATGINLERVTLLVSALGVGIGFGMQNVVNNFVSGLILLFERPVKVGDIVQIGDLTGEVRRIGIRASTVRTADGAEVIMPNGKLVSDPVTNWTLSDRMRRFEVTVGVAYGTDPERVLELLARVADEQPQVVAEPAPVALFLGFGDSALNFQLRAWTDRFEDWLRIRSALSVAVNRALVDAGIDIPFPQREVRIGFAQPVPVRVVDGN